ncbi:MAG: hypothetical protein K2X66_18585 [Cyanobacteria bacterium]|nr:hypothetical protein [Cyanobacteriota bacterium]
MRGISAHQCLKLVLIPLLLCLFLSSPLSAEAGKKKKGGDAELQKALTPITKIIDDLLSKVQSHYLFSPKDSGQLTTLKFQLLDLMKDNPTNPLLTKPIYQAATIYGQREQYGDSMDLYTFLVTNFPDTPYGLRAKMDLEQIKKQSGMDTSTPAPATAAPGAKGPADKK